MKTLLLSLLLSLNLFAYKVGDTLGNNIAQHLKIQTDKVYVIDFFASWCGSCKKEIPLISQVHTQIDTSKVEIIGIDVDKDIKQGQKFQKEMNINFRVIDDPSNIIISKFNPIGMPTLYYVKNTKVIKIITGAINNIDEQILDDLKEME